MGSPRKHIPDVLKKLIQQRGMTNAREAQKFCKERGFHASPSWFNLNKDQWMPDPDAKMIFFEEDDTFDTDIATRIMLLKGQQVKDFSERKHFSSDQLKRFCRRTPEACADFARECLVWKGIPIELQDYQLKMIEGWLTRPRTTYPMGRGIGKDFTLSVFLSWYCTIFPNTRVIIVCPATRQVNIFVKENFLIMLQTSAVLYDSIAEYKEEEITFTNGSQVFSYGAMSFIKGKHNINMIFCNEASEIPEHVYENVLMPMLGTTTRTGLERGLFGVLGVPGGQAGYFWRKSYEGTEDILDESAEFYVMNLPTSMNKHYSKEQLEINRQTMSEDAFLQEHEAKFLDLEGSLFSQKVLDKMKADYECHYGIVDKHLEYYMGIDWGRINDYSVFTIISRNKATKELRIEYINHMRKGFDIQHKWIEESEKLYNFKRIIPEYNGIGIPPSERLKNQFGTKVKYFLPTPANWFDAFTRLRDEGVNGNISIPAGELKLIRQLRLLTFQIRANRLTVRSEGKDDYSQSCAIAYYGVRRAGQIGVAGSI